MPGNRSPAARRFWAYEEMPDAPAVLRLDGVIAEESWWGDEVTPKMFRDELDAHPGDIDVYINSPGGDVIAATQIYTMLQEHKGRVRVKIDGLAASAASIIAMAGDEVLMAPTAYMMIHNSSSIALGNKQDMRHEADVLDEVDKGIREAYRQKTGLRDSKLEEMMDAETWMSARTCIDLGFADGYIAADPDEEDEPEEPEEDPDEEEEDPDNIEHVDRRVAARYRGHPAVAWSARGQMAGLRRALQNEEVLASANHEALRRLRDADARRKSPEDTDADEKARRAQLMKLRLLSV